MDPYIEFFNEYSHLAAIPIVVAALYIGWRKGFLGLKGTARRNLIGLGVVGLIGLFVYLPPIPNERGEYTPQFTDAQICAVDEDCVASRQVDGSCCPPLCSGRGIYNRATYSRQADNHAAICGDRKFKCRRASCKTGPGYGPPKAKCIDGLCEGVRPKSSKATGGKGKRRKGKGQR